MSYCAVLTIDYLLTTYVDMYISLTPILSTTTIPTVTAVRRHSARTRQRIRQVLPTYRQGRHSDSPFQRPRAPEAAVGGVRAASAKI